MLSSLFRRSKNRGLVQLLRQYSTQNSESGAVTTKITKNVVNNKGEHVLQETLFRKTWNSVPNTAKYFLGIYTLIGSLDYFKMSYNNGKSALLVYRINNNAIDITASGEWNAVVEGCNRDWVGNLWKSAVFPVTIFQHVAPNLVLFFNPKKTPYI